MIRRTYHRLIDTILATWGLALVLRHAMVLIYGPGSHAVSPPDVGSVMLFGEPYPVYRLIVMGVSLATTLLASISDGVNVVDRRRRIVYTNRAFDEMFGYAPGELVGRDIAVLNAGYEITPRLRSSRAATGFTPSATSCCTAAFSSVSCAPVAPRAMSSRTIAAARFGATPRATSSVSTPSSTVIARCGTIRFMSRIVPSGSPSWPKRRATSYESIVPTVRLTLRIGMSIETFSPRSSAAACAARMWARAG